MSELVDNFQVIFLPGRLITNNIIFSNELMKGMVGKIFLVDA